MYLAMIGTAFSHLKTSMDIAKLINNSTSSLDEAETKLKLAELISSLADLKMELSGIKNDLIEKDEIIRECNEKLREKKSLEFDGKLYWKDKDETPYCPICYEQNNSYIHLFKDNYKYECKNCDNIFDYNYNDMLNKVINSQILK